MFILKQMNELEKLDYYYKYTNPKNHKIFNYCYWGKFRTDKYELERLKEIAKNRDELVEIFSIKSYKYSSFPKWVIKQVVIEDCKDSWGEIRDIRDHIEYYNTKEGDILAVFSKYIRDDDKDLDLIKEKGYLEFKPIYWSDQKTFVKLIGKRI